MKRPTVRSTSSRTSGALTFSTALAMSMALLCTSGCGQKGPLYLPEPAPAVVPASGDAKDKQKRDAAGDSVAPTDSTAPADSAH